MTMYDIGTIRVGSTLPCMCQNTQNVRAISYWEQEHCFLYQCVCKRIVVLSIMGFIVGIMKPKRGS